MLVSAWVARGLASLVALSQTPVDSPQPAATVRLKWVAPPACPDDDAVRAAMQARLDADPTLDPTTVIAVEIAVREHEGGFAAQLEVDAPSGQTSRALQAEQCAVIVDASALIVAMAAGVASPLEPAPPDDPPPENPEPPPADAASGQTPAIDPRPPKPTPADPPPSPDPPPVRATPHIQASAGLGLGAIETPAGAVGLGGGVTLGRWQLDAMGRVWFSQRLPMPQRSGLGADVWLWTLGLRAGPALRWRRFEFPLQVGVDAGAAHARGYGVTTPRDTARAWVSAGAFPAALWWATERFGLGVETELSGVLYRPVFSIADAEPSFAPPRVRGGIYGRIQVRFSVTDRSPPRE